MLLISIRNFIATDEEREGVESSFQRHGIEFDFTNSRPGYLPTVPAASGVYFIAGERSGHILKIYVGQAANVRRRMGDYHRGFQVHSPNDNKLAMFQRWLEEHDPGWTITLRTISVGDDERAAAEADWITRLDPLVNGTGHPDDEARTMVEQAFRHFFCSYFAARVETEEKVSSSASPAPRASPTPLGTESDSDR